MTRCCVAAVATLPAVTASPANARFWPVTVVNVPREMGGVR